jgi:hypothetical protein
MSNPDESQELRDGDPPPDTPREPGAFRRHWRLWAVVASAAIVAVAVSFLPGLSSGSAAGPQAWSASTARPTSSLGTAAGQHSPTATGRHPESATQASAQTPEEIIANMHVPAQLAVALRKWNAGTGGAALDKVSDELSSAAQSGGIKLFSPMKLACSSLAAAVVAAKASPLIPDAVTQKWYAAALAQLASAAAVCQSAISVQGAGENVQTEENPALLHRSESELAAGAKDLYHVTVQLAAANNQ